MVPIHFLQISCLLRLWNPCPCGYYPGAKCKCTDYEIIKYRGKISGPINDRMRYTERGHSSRFFAICRPESRSFFRRTAYKSRKGQRDTAGEICAESGINCNAQMTTELIQKYCILEADSLKILRETSEKYGYSARVIHKLLRLARTSADLDGEEKIRRKDIEKVLTCRDLDKSNSKMVVVR